MEAHIPMQVVHIPMQVEVHIRDKPVMSAELKKIVLFRMRAKNQEISVLHIDLSVFLDDKGLMAHLWQSLRTT